MPKNIFHAHPERPPIRRQHPVGAFSWEIGGWVSDYTVYRHTPVPGEWLRVPLDTRVFLTDDTVTTVTTADPSLRAEFV